ncbi:uncharacterized protein BDV14DRAFT_206220 [Aspergillus stella-maris]|uniref:uncharacterized protein n=1 Tax=Aspergillus stella-maris TaxID=1810926 RepID=UPI003CCDE8DC
MGTYNDFGSQSPWELVYLSVNHVTRILEDTVDRQVFHEHVDQARSTMVQYNKTAPRSTQENISVAAKPDATEPQFSSSGSRISDIMNAAGKGVWNDLEDFVPGLHNIGDKVSIRALKASLISLGVTTCGGDHNWPKIVQLANQWAKRRVEIASQAKTATTATIIALYGLAIAEIVTYDSWGDVQKGSIFLDHILQILGRQEGELKDQGKLRLFIWLKVQIITEHLLRGRRVTNLAPIKIAPDLQAHPATFGEKLALIMGALSCLQADIYEDKFSDQTEIALQAQKIYNDLHNWEQSLPQYFQYSDTWACHIMNLYRCAQIIVLHTCLSNMPDKLSQSLEPLATAILDSIPYHFRNTAFGQQSQYGNNNSPIHCTALLWPLVLASTAGGRAMESSKSWLQFLCESMHFGHGSILLNVLKDGKDIHQALRVNTYLVRTTQPIMAWVVLVKSASITSESEIMRQIQKRFPFAWYTLVLEEQ